VPGVPSVYYGSEWGISGAKRAGDDRPLRPHLRLPDARQHAPHPDLAAAIARFARIRRGSRALRRGSYRQLHVAAEQIAFARQVEGETVVVAVNSADMPATVEVQAPVRDGATLTDLLSPSDRVTAAGGCLRVEVPPRWARILASR
jgi:glycosidase